MSSRGVNKVILVGNLGNDPEIRYTPNGQAIANLSLATSEQWKDKGTGEKRVRTEWHRVVIFGNLAKIAGEYLKKGSQVYLEGKLQTRKWQGNDGKDNYTTEVVIDVGGSMQMLGGANDRPASTTRVARNAQTNQQQAPARQQSAPDFNDSFDDDIPF